jgi:hypothetical protein
MGRPRDPETHALLPPPHRRVDMMPYQQAALFKLAEDPRSCALPVKRKLALIDRAVDHVIDGDKPPAWVWKKDNARPGNTFLRDLWEVAVRECRKVKAVRRG